MSLFQDIKKKILKEGRNQVSNFRVGMNTARQPSESIYTRSAQGLLHGTGKLLADTGNLATKIQSSRVANVLNPATLMIRQNQPRMKNEINLFRNNLDNVKPLTTAGKVSSFVGENLPAVALPATKGITAAKVSSPAMRMFGNSLLRAGENMGINSAYRYAKDEKTRGRDLALDAAIGAGANALLSPRATGAGVKEFNQNFKDVMQKGAREYDGLSSVIARTNNSKSIVERLSDNRNTKDIPNSIKKQLADEFVDEKDPTVIYERLAQYRPKNAKVKTYKVTPGFAKNPFEKAPLSNEAKQFGTFNKIDNTKLTEKAYISPNSGYKGDFATKKSANGLSYHSSEKLNELNFHLKQAGHSGVNAKDFKGIYSLDQVLKDDALFAKYPTLKQNNVVFADFHTNAKRGMSVGDTIYINSKLYDKNPELLNSTIVHEIEHAKQGIKGTSAIRDEVVRGPKEAYQNAYASEQEIAARARQDAYTKSVSQPLSTTPKTAEVVAPVGTAEDPVQKIVQALREVKPLRKEQNVINADLRKQKFAKLMSTRAKTGGEQGYYKELGALKGSTKVDFESVRPKLTQTDIDSLFNKINDSNIGDWEKVNAKSGLMKLLTKEGATMPTGGELKLMNDVFGSDMTKAILANRTTWQKFLQGAGEVLNLPRALMASFDLSAPLRQGVVMTSRPKQFFPAIVSMFKQAGSEKAFRSVQQDISSRPTYNLMRESKLALTDIGGDLAGREEMFMSNLGEKIPVLKYGIKASNRAYTGFLNKLRADVFDDMLAKSKALGNDNPDVAQDIAKFVNSATGRGDLGALNRAAPVLNSIFFSPRLMAARVNMLNPAFYVKMDPMVRKEAVKSMLTLGATVGTVLGLAKAGGASVETDPKSADFGKIKVGDTRYDILGGFQQYLVLASRLATGKMTSSTTGKEISLTEGYKPTTRLDIIINFLKSKENPILSYLTGAMEGTTQLGQQFNPASEAINRFIPMFAQDIVDLTEDKGFAKSIGMELPSAFGVGVQTYGKQMPVMGTTPAGNSTIKWRNPYDIGERILNKVTGGGGSPFSKEEQNTLDQARRQTAQQKADVEKVVAGVQKKINKGETVSGVTTLPDGRGMYITDKGIQYADTPEEANVEVKKTELKKSGKNLMLYNDKVLRLQSDGSVKVDTKDNYDYQVNTNKLTKLKSDKNYKGWIDLASKQLDILDKQMQDPTLDELEIGELQAKADTLISNMEKYAGYGGFKKPKKGKKISLTIPKLSQANISMPKVTLKAMKVSANGGLTFRRPQVGATGQSKRLKRGV